MQKAASLIVLLMHRSFDRCLKWLAARNKLKHLFKNGHSLSVSYRMLYGSESLIVQEQRILALA